VTVIELPGKLVAILLDRQLLRVKLEQKSRNGPIHAKNTNVA
jgi:hypothetical protein